MSKQRYFCVTEAGRILITTYDPESGVFYQPDEHYGPVQQLLVEGFSELSVRTFHQMGFIV